MKIVTKKVLSSMVVVSMSLSVVLPASANGTQESAQEQNNSNFIVSDEGVSINRTYYSKEEFEELLNQAVEQQSSEIFDKSPGFQTNAIPAIVAGTYLIPGVGEVMITATGVILIGGAVIAGGTWLYNTVANWFSERAEVQAIKQSIPSRLKQGSGEVDLSQFNQKVNGKTAYKEKGGWTIEKDTAGHGGRKWKLKDKSNDRVASLDENGKVLSK